VPPERKKIDASPWRCNGVWNEEIQLEIGIAIEIDMIWDRDTKNAVYRAVPSPEINGDAGYHNPLGLVKGL